MKTFLLALAFFGANAMACPDAAKEAAAPITDKPVVAVVKAAKPAAPPRATPTAVTKVAAKPSPDVRKATTL
jgi:hypothetical protein